MKIAIAGSTGLVGTQLTTFLQKEGHDVVRILRPGSKDQKGERFISWDPSSETINLADLEGFDLVINLCGASLADKRWSSSYKKTIHDSRVQATSFLAKSLAQLKRAPKLFLSASAIGYYGNHPAKIVIDEQSPVGNDFLAGVCHDWEQAAKPAIDKKIRTVFLRFGAILSVKGGALAKMLPLFQFGLGGRLGNGEQMFSWIALDEIPHIVLHVMNKAVYLNGALNCVAPHAVSNKEFTKTLGQVLKRPTLFPAPPIALKLALGEMADTLLLNGANVIPERLRQTQYTFKYPVLQPALNACLKLKL